MKANYDFSKMKSRRNPYARKLKRQITIRIASGTLEYFRGMSEETGVPYQNLIDSYLADCAASHRKLHTKWA
jgi:predicted DNA binding CopG/RHH family protein